MSTAAIDRATIERIVREIVLKGAGLRDVGGDLWPLALILLVLASLALLRFRRTLD